MINIWLFLLGLPHLLSETFKPIEIALTITIGVAAESTATRGNS